MTRDPSGRSLAPGEPVVYQVGASCHGEDAQRAKQDEKNHVHYRKEGDAEQVEDRADGGGVDVVYDVSQCACVCFERMAGIEPEAYAVLQGAALPLSYTRKLSGSARNGGPLIGPPLVHSYLTPP